MEYDATLNSLEYPDDTGALAVIPTEAYSLLKPVKQFVAYQNSQKVPYTKDYWTKITQAQFDAFRVSNGTYTAPIYATPVAPPVVKLPVVLAPSAAMSPAILAPPVAITHAPAVCQRPLSACTSEAWEVQDLLDTPTPGRPCTKCTPQAT